MFSVFVLKSKNFHFNALKEVIEPMVMVPTQNYFSRITIKSDTQRPRQTIDWLEKAWKKHFPHLLLDYDFLTDQRANQYKSEARFSKIFTSFSIVSLLMPHLVCMAWWRILPLKKEKK